MSLQLVVQISISQLNAIIHGATDTLTNGVYLLLGAGRY